MLNSTIYRQDHIFGRVGTELSADLYEQWGRAFAQMLPSGAKFLVTSDYRESSEEYKVALINGLRTRKIHVLDAGSIPTDLASYGAWFFKTVGFASVTGGSYSPEWNGLRWNFDSPSPTMDEQMAQLQLPVTKLPYLGPVPGSSLQTCDASSSWIPWLQSIWYDTPRKPFRVIVDPMHGNWSDLARKAFQAVFPHAVFESFHDTAEPDFGGLVPRSKYPKSIQLLCDEVTRTQADMGIALDADAGDFVVVDRHGVPLLSEEINWFVLHDLLGVALEGETFVHDAYCSEQILAEGRRLGGRPVLSRIGDRAFSQRMRETDALIGLGSGGEIYFRGVQGRRIVIFALCWLIDYMLIQDTTLTDWRKRCPFFFSTPEYRTPAVPMEEVVSRLTDQWRKQPSQTTEGFRFDTSIGRIDIRSIPDYGQLGFRFNAPSRPEALRFIRESIRALEGIDEIAPFLEQQFAIEQERRFIEEPT